MPERRGTFRVFCSEYHLDTLDAIDTSVHHLRPYHTYKYDIEQNYCVDIRFRKRD